MPTPRQELADALQEARLGAGFKTHKALAEALHITRSVITRAESPGQPVPSEGVLRGYAKIAGADFQELMGLAARATAGSPEWFVPYRSAESLATLLRCWAPMIVPGLLQTEEYAYEILAVEPYTPDRLTGLVATRMERRTALDRALLVAILDHSILQRRIGSAQIMADQCTHLVALAERSNITLHVMPPDTNHGVWGGLDIASRDGSVTVAFTTGRADMTTTSRDVVDSTMQAFERLLGYAMPPTQSLDFLRTQEGQWKEQAS